MGNIKTEINQRYLSGERKFTKQNLSEADLRGINLAGANLKNSDLSFANLENANLTGVNLSQCNLKGANLKNVDLTDAILNDSDLSFSKLNGANLTNVHAKNTNFQQAYLNQVKAYKGYFLSANFTQASLNHSDFTESNIKAANLKNAFLTGVNLTQAYLGEAKLGGACLTSTVTNKTYFRNAQYDQKTLFARQFEPQNSGLVYRETRQIQVQELLQMINHIIKFSNKYLGNTLVAKYWESAKPNNEWTNKFQLQSNGEISYDGSINSYMDDFQVQWYCQWVKKYCQSCSMIVYNFEELIEKDLSHFPCFPCDLRSVA